MSAIGFKSREAAAIAPQGTPGPDTFPGTPGDDVFSGGGGRDTMRGGRGDDVLRGGAGVDDIKGNAGSDRLFGDRDADTVNGGGGRDRIRGGQGDDVLIGGGGADDIRGDVGDDTILGGAGRDTIRGGRGEDVLTGGGGADRFIFASTGDGVDRIEDFSLAQHDRLDLRALLSGFGSGDALGDFVRLTPGNGGTTVAVAPAGNGAFVDLALLAGESLSLQDLLDGGGLLPVPPQPGNRPPELNRNIVDQTATEGSEFSLLIPDDTFRDPDAGDSLNLSVQENTDWLEYDPDTRVLSGTPGPFDRDPVTVRMEATDEQGLSTSASFRVRTTPLSVSGENQQSGSVPNDNGAAGSTSPSISGDGRFVAQVFQESNLDGDVFEILEGISVRDLATDNVWKVFEQDDDFDQFVSSPAISSDGRVVAFAETAGEAEIRVVRIADTDPLVTDDIFVRPLTGAFNARAKQLSLSADGRFVAFEDGTNVVVAEVATGREAIIPNAANPSISGDGHRIAYQEVGVSFEAQDVLVATLDTRTMTIGDRVLVSVDLGGSSAGLSSDPTISADGRFVAFESGASDLVTGDTNDATDIFVSDLATGRTITRASVDAQGHQSGQAPSNPSLSADGSFVAFDMPIDGSGSRQVLVKDLAPGGELGPGGELRIVSVNRDGEPGSAIDSDSGFSGSSVGPSLSADGRFVAFSSEATNLTDDGNQQIGIFLAPTLPSAAFPLYAPVVDFPGDDATAVGNSIGLAEVLDVASGGPDVGRPDAVSLIAIDSAGAAPAVPAGDVAGALTNLLADPGDSATAA